MAANLRSRKYDALAGLMKSVILPHLASWRWATLDTCIKALARFVLSCSVVFEPEAYQRTRDPTKLRVICDAFRSPVWHAQFHVVAWYCDMMTGILGWRWGTCPCHGPEDPAAERDTFGGKGRRWQGVGRLVQFQRRGCDQHKVLQLFCF